MDKFGVTGVRNAWYDPSKVTDHVIQGYTKVSPLCDNFRKDNLQLRNTYPY